MWHDMSWHGWGFHMFSWWSVVVMGALIIAVFAVIARTGEGETAPGGDAPLDILKRRYAAGEIDDDEFEHMRRELTS